MQIWRINQPRVPEWWPFVAEGFQKAIDHSRNLRDISSIFDELVTGVWMLWVVLDDKGTLLGAATTEPLQTATGFVCNIPFAWSTDPKRDIHAAFFEHIEPLAAAQGFKEIKFISGRPGYERKAKSLGFSKGFVEYRKELSLH